MPARKPKASELEYYGQVGGGPGEPTQNTVVAAHEGRIVGHLSSAMEPGVGRKLRVAWVDPDLQKRGIGSTMYHLERSRSGPMAGDNVVTRKGGAFQRSIGVTPAPRQEEYSRRWVSHTVTADLFGGPAGEAAVRETIQGKQGHMLQEQQFDPSLVRAAAPQKPPRRRGPQPEQGQLFNPKEYPPGGLARSSTIFGGGTPRNARGQIQSKKRV